jgi:hypothetical protein
MITKKKNLRQLRSTYLLCLLLGISKQYASEDNVSYHHKLDASIFANNNYILFDKNMYLGIPDVRAPLPTGNFSNFFAAGKPREVVGLGNLTDRGNFIAFYSSDSHILIGSTAGNNIQFIALNAPPLPVGQIQIPYGTQSIHIPKKGSGIVFSLNIDENGTITTDGNGSQSVTDLIAANDPTEKVYLGMGENNLISFTAGAGNLLLQSEGTGTGIVMQTDSSAPVKSNPIVISTQNTSVAAGSIGGDILLKTTSAGNSTGSAGNITLQANATSVTSNSVSGGTITFDTSAAASTGTSGDIIMNLQVGLTSLKTGGGLQQGEIRIPAGTKSILLPVSNSINLLGINKDGVLVSDDIPASLTIGTVGLTVLGPIVAAGGIVFAGNITDQATPSEANIIIDPLGNITTLGMINGLNGIQSNGLITGSAGLTITGGDTSLKNLIANTTILGDTTTGVFTALSGGEQITLDSSADTVPGGDIVLRLNGTEKGNIIIPDGSYHITIPEPGFYNPISIDSDGNLTTDGGGGAITIGSLTAAATASQTVAIGIPGENYIGYINNSANVLIQGLAQNNSAVNVASNRITLDTSTNSNTSGGDIIMKTGVGSTTTGTGGAFRVYTFPLDTQGNGGAIMFDSSGGSLAGSGGAFSVITSSLTATKSGNVLFNVSSPKGTGGDIIFNLNGTPNNKGRIQIPFGASGLDLPLSGYNPISIDKDGYLTTAGGGGSTTIGSLTAAATASQTVAIGIAGKNYIGYTNNADNVLIQGLAQNNSAVNVASNRITLDTSTNSNMSGGDIIMKTGVGSSAGGTGGTLRVNTGPLNNEGSGGAIMFNSSGGSLSGVGGAFSVITSSQTTTKSGNVTFDLSSSKGTAGDAIFNVGGSTKGNIIVQGGSQMITLPTVTGAMQMIGIDSTGRFSTVNGTNSVFCSNNVSYYFDSTNATSFNAGGVAVGATASAPITISTAISPTGSGITSGGITLQTTTTGTQTTTKSGNIRLSAASSAGSAGNIFLFADTVNTGGNGGIIQLKTSVAGPVVGGVAGQILLSAWNSGSGSGGEILLESKNTGTGNAGNISINASSTSGSGGKFSVFTSTGGSGNGGAISLESKNIGTGNAGNISIDASSSSGSGGSFSLITSGGGAIGRGGDISLNASSNNGQGGTFSVTTSSNSVTAGDAGSVNFYMNAGKNPGKGKGGNFYIYLDGTIKGEVVLPDLTRSVTATGSAATLYLAPGGILTSNSSSRRYKQNISYLAEEQKNIGMHRLVCQLLKPAAYIYKNEGFKYGFIAEDVATIPGVDKTVFYNEAGEVEGIDYNGLFTYLFFALTQENQSIHEKVNAIDAQYQEMKEELADTQKKYQDLIKKYKSLEKMVTKLMEGQTKEK